MKNKMKRFLDATPSPEGDGDASRREILTFLFERR
jgi:hypothetical protein